MALAQSAAHTVLLLIFYLHFYNDPQLSCYVLVHTSAFSYSSILAVVLSDEGAYWLLHNLKGRLKGRGKKKFCEAFFNYFTSMKIKSGGTIPLRDLRNEARCSFQRISPKEPVPGNICPVSRDQEGNPYPPS